MMKKAILYMTALWTVLYGLSALQCSPCAIYRSHYCPGQFGFTLYENDSYSKKILNDWTYEEIILTDKKGVELKDVPGRCCGDLRFSLAPGCEAEYTNLDGQVFKDTLFLNLTPVDRRLPKDVDTLVLEYKFEFITRCNVNSYEYTNFWYNGRAFEALEDAVLKAAKR
jgi:hypothetical protein